MKIITFTLTLLSSSVLAFESGKSNSLSINANTIDAGFHNPVFDFLDENLHVQSNNPDNSDDSSEYSEDIYANGIANYTETLSLIPEPFSISTVAASRAVSADSGSYDSSESSDDINDSDDSSVSSDDINMDEAYQSVSLATSFQQTLQNFEQLKMRCGIGDTQGELKNMFVQFYTKASDLLNTEISSKNIVLSLQTNKEADELRNSICTSLLNSNTIYNCNENVLATFREPIIDDLGRVVGLIVDLFPDDQDY
ncbi:MAG: hypothetical protein AB8G05_18265 [Oligoflexales bacterium]